MKAIRASGARVVILNHPRDLHSGFRPFDPEHFDAVAGRPRGGTPYEFHAVEVINSGALQSDPFRLFRDWFALLNSGHRLAGVAGSDSHDVARYIVGQARTYVAVDDRDPGRIDVMAAVESFLAGRVQASLGLLTTLELEEGELVVRVVGPSWTRADRLELFANGERIRAVEIRSGPDAIKFEARWPAPPLPHDAWLVALASGPGVREPYGALPKPYKPASKAWTPRVLGSSSAVWFDGDRDGRFTSPRGYAEAIVARVGTDPRAMARELAGYDAAVRVQAAALLDEDEVRR